MKDDPFGMFMHVNMPTYQDAQWADPNGNPAGFNPTTLFLHLGPAQRRQNGADRESAP
ncbi:hypothetical protein [Streptomyces sp. NBC_01465]|uniref:hypothetical protein n=1 Tax=Streptomyces sp. NBC_01465 TaxID=2903878 RepID=UPI002E324A27|nr:hypothetical protein [Streptomyces sp. NBC_01465]